MKTSLQLFLAGLVLLTQGFGQEPKQPLAKQVASGQIRTETVANGSLQPAAPVVEPKALPPLNPTLGDIAREARAAHATAQKAQMVVDSDTADGQNETPAENETAAK
jgi:hypothetical protein